MRVVVGRIGRPHGIKGEVTVEPRTDEPDERFAPGAVLLLDDPAKQLVVERMHWHSGRLLVWFRGVADRNAAEALRGLLARDPDGLISYLRGEPPAAASTDLGERGMTA